MGFTLPVGTESVTSVVEKTPRRWLFLEQTFLRSSSFMIFAIWQWILLPASQCCLQHDCVLETTQFLACAIRDAFDDSCLTLFSHARCRVITFVSIYCQTRVVDRHQFLLGKGIFVYLSNLYFNKALRHSWDHMGHGAVEKKPPNFNWAVISSPRLVYTESEKTNTTWLCIYN